MKCKECDAMALYIASRRCIVGFSTSVPTSAKLILLMSGFDDVFPRDLFPTDIIPSDFSPTNIIPTDLFPTDILPTDLSSVIFPSNTFPETTETSEFMTSSPGVTSPLATSKTSSLLVSIFKKRAQVPTWLLTCCVIIGIPFTHLFGYHRFIWGLASQSAFLPTGCFP